MSKSHRILRHTKAVTNNGEGQMYEHSETYDDHLLPDATELGKLKDLDPTIIEWVKDKSGKEQGFRHKFEDKKVRVILRSSKMAFVLDLVTCFYAFIIVILSMYFSYYLIENNQTLMGTVFAGGTMILTANAFLNFRKKVTNVSEQL